VRFFPHLADAESAELRAGKLGLLALEKNLRRVVLEMDSSGVVAKLNRDEQDRPTHGPLVEEIKSLLRKFNGSLVRSVRRSANGSAHVLASYGCENKICNRWCGVAPNCIAHQLDMDLCVG
jgi:hypothetical protein